MLEYHEKLDARIVRHARHRATSALMLVLALLVATSATANDVPLSSTLGAYFFPNPGTDGHPDFDQEFDAFSAALGRVPVVRGSFADNRQGLINLAGSQWWTVNPLSRDPRFQDGKITPVIGLPLAAAEDTGNADAILRRFDKIAAGEYDSQWAGVVAIWKKGGFKRIVVRIGYEMNGHWMAWAVPRGNKVPAWNAAFRRVATIMKATGASEGVNVIIAWNPCLVIWEDVSTDSMYPGDDVVDLISLDIYSSVGWARNLTNWDANGTAVGSSSNLKDWASIPSNRRHFWMYPDATELDPTGAKGNGWGLAKHIAFAKAHRKRIAISETGVGVSPGAPDTDVDDDGELPKLLWEQLHDYPFGLDHVIIWSLDEGDFRGNFLDNGKRPHPLAKAAWRRYFGDGR